MAEGLSISEFRYVNRVDFHAVITWDPLAPGTTAEAVMRGEHSPGVTWETINGGIAFLDVHRDGATLRLETWGTDTNGDYTPRAIDIFTLPVDLTQPFPPALEGQQVPSPHGLWNYLIRSVPGNANALRIDAGKSVSSTP